MTNDRPALGLDVLISNVEDGGEKRVRLRDVTSIMHTRGSTVHYT